MAEATTRAGDDEIWLRLFTAAITGMAGRGGQPQPAEIARVCAEIADSALGEAHRRRDQP